MLNDPAGWFTIRKLAVIIVLLWGVFTTGYVVFDQWQDFKVRSQQTSFAQGREDVLRQVMQLALRCQPVDLSLDKDKVQLVSVACLQQATNKNQPATPVK
jgi:hypothetical protein